MTRDMPIARMAGVAAAGALALWVSVGVTLNLTLARRMPALSEAWWPVGVTAKVVRGRSLLDAGPLPPAVIARAQSDLRTAARREPVNTYALSTLGALADLQGNKRQAQTLFRLSEGVSRRNALAELWLIEDAVGRGSIGEAVRHYDRAMRVSIDSRQILLPVLVSAAKQPAIAEDLLPLLARRPLWWKDYLEQLAAIGDDSAVMAASLQAITPDLRNAEERTLAENVLRRMVALKDDRRAVLAANRLEGRSGQTRSLRGGDFEHDDGVLPFAWWLRDEGNVRAYRDTVPDGTLGLWIVTSGETSGGAAQQLIGLPPGRYALSGSVGGVPVDPLARPSIVVSCSSGVTLSRFALPPSPGDGRGFKFAFVVPRAACPTQWLTVFTAPAADTSVWLDAMTITR